MRKAFKYRLCPNAMQTKALNEMLETHRRLYNSCLEERKNAWEQAQRSVTFQEQRKHFIDHYRENEFYARLNTNSAHTTIKRLDLAFQAFFRRVRQGETPGYPRFKGKDFFHSILFGTYPNGARLTGDRLRVQHVGTIRVKLHRPVEGTIKTLLLKCEAGKWFVVFSCDLGDVVPVPTIGTPTVVSLGDGDFLRTRDGHVEELPKYLETSLDDIRKRQRSVSRKQKGGANRAKAKTQLAKAHAHIANQRRDHQHKVARAIVNRSSVIEMDGLEVKPMIRHGRPRTRRDRLFNLALHDAAWSEFTDKLKSKAEAKGIPFRNLREEDEPGAGA